MVQTGALAHPFLTAEWRDLVMLSWDVEPGLVEPLVPRGTELDGFRGRCLVSLVGFRFLGVRVRGRRVLFHTDFDEVNLRCYVRRPAGDEVRRGVVFVRELVPLPAVTLVANWVYGERYSTVPMRHHVDADRVAYEWRLGGRWQGLAARPAGEAALPAPGSEEEFVTEHHWGYAHRHRRTVEYQVTHPRWPVRQAHVLGLDCDAARLYGPGFAAAMARPPTSAFVVDGSAVAVGPGRPL